MAVYFLFSHDRCDRCGRITHVRSMSFFTSETLCMGCLAGEAQSMSELREIGLDPADFEDCGCIPTREWVESGQCVPSRILVAMRQRTPDDGPITEADVRQAVRRLRVRKAVGGATPIEPEAGRGLPPAV